MMLFFKRFSSLSTLKPQDTIKILSQLTRSNKFEEAEDLYQIARQQGMKSIKLFSQGIQISLKQKQFEKAWAILKEYRLHHGFPDTILYTQMIQAAAMQNNAERALNLFAEMETNGFPLNERTYTALMQAVANRQDHADQIFDIVERMKSQGFKLNAYHYINIIGACGKLREMKRCKSYWNAIINEDHKCHKQLYRKLMWAYYFKISDMTHLLDLDVRKDLAKSLTISHNIQALCFVDVEDKSLRELLCEVFTLKEHFGVCDPYTKILCMLDEELAFKSIDKMNETLLIEIIKSCGLFGNLEFAISAFQQFNQSSPKIKLELINILAKNGHVKEALELTLEYPNPRIVDFKPLYKACFDNLEFLKIFIAFFKHPLDHNLKLRVSRRIHKLEVNSF